MSAETPGRMRWVKADRDTAYDTGIGGYAFIQNEGLVLILQQEWTILVRRADEFGDGEETRTEWRNVPVEEA